MDKQTLLIEEAKRRYSEVVGRVITTLPYPQEGIDWGSGKNDRFHNNSPCGYYNHFKYDEQADTLTMWGAGLALIYHKGKWATVIGQEEPIQEIYQIY